MKQIHIGMSPITAWEESRSYGNQFQSLGLEINIAKYFYNIYTNFFNCRILIDKGHDIAAKLVQLLGKETEVSDIILSEENKIEVQQIINNLVLQNITVTEAIDWIERREKESFEKGVEAIQIEFKKILGIYD